MWKQDRQREILEEGGIVEQESGFSIRKDETRSMRSKEEAHNYRYFADPDLLPLDLTAIKTIRVDKIPSVQFQRLDCRHRRARQNRSCQTNKKAGE